MMSRIFIAAQTYGKKSHVENNKAKNGFLFIYLQCQALWKTLA